MLIIECCGCENLALVKLTNFSEDSSLASDKYTGEEFEAANWEESIYPPVTYRRSPAWFDDLPDQTLRDISLEIYKSLQSGSHYLATFGSRTLIDRLIVLTVGDKGNFTKGLQALQDEGKISSQEREILTPVVHAGNAAAHRGWSPSKDQLDMILDTVEGLIRRLLVLPAQAEALKDSVPPRSGAQKKQGEGEKSKSLMTNKIAAAPRALRSIYDELERRLRSFGNDVSVHPQKHYIAFRRNRNFASVQLYNQKKIIRIYLNLNPDEISENTPEIRDVRQIGHFGTGDLEITIASVADLDSRTFD